MFRRIKHNNECSNDYIFKLSFQACCRKIPQMHHFSFIQRYNKLQYSKEDYSKIRSQTLTSTELFKKMLLQNLGPTKFQLLKLVKLKVHYIQANEHIIQK